MSAANDTQELRKREAWAQKRSMLYAQQVTELEARCAVLARALEDILAALPVMHITWEPGADDLVFVRAREALAAAPTREEEPRRSLPPNPDMPDLAPDDDAPLPIMPAGGVTLTEEQAERLALADEFEQFITQAGLSVRFSDWSLGRRAAVLRGEEPPPT